MTINAMKSKNRNSKAQSSATSHAVSNPSSKDISISTIGKSGVVSIRDPHSGDDKGGDTDEEQEKREGQEEVKADDISLWVWWLPEGAEDAGKMLPEIRKEKT